MDPTTQKIDAQTGSDLPDFQIPGYKILRELGHGGMAHVYLSIQESFGREVALKILSPHLADDDQFSKRFLREARIVSQLNHQNIVTVYDAGKQGKYHYMSMEYIPGKDLKQLKDSISREEAIRIVKDVAAALDFAGRKGIVHRDVKPENIMIHQSDNRVILMDFGIAHGDDATQGMTQTGKAIGTPHFMSPEQTKGLKVDHRSDIYSLGVVLFQLLAGYLPFDADSAVAVGIKHLTAPIPLLPGGLEIFQPIINHCLSKQPQHRYQKAAEIITALNKITGDQLENINTQAKIFKNVGADQDAETKISEVPTNPKRKIPDLVFPSQNKITAENELVKDSSASNRRRNLLVLLLLITIGWAANEKQKELTQFWGYEALPKIVSIFPNLFPKSYSQFWANKLEKENTHVINKTAATKSISIASSNDQIDANKTSSSTALPIQEQQLIQNEPKKDKITLLKEGLDDNPKNAVELATFYKNLLQQNEKDPVALQGLKELREWIVKKIGVAFATENASLARQYINLMKENFPKSTTNKRFIRLEKKVAFLERLDTHFIAAENYFNAGALIKPINKNALNEINKVLLLAPQNEDAKNFINKIIKFYIDKTSELQAKGNIHNAILMAEEGIAALNNNPDLIKKRNELKIKVKHNKNITALFTQAKKYQSAGQLIKPRSYNAYFIYQEILKLEKNNLQAQAELKRIHQQLALDLTSLINKGELKKAKQYLQAAFQRYGRSSLLANVQLKLNDALGELAPQIKTIKLSNSAVKNLITKNTLQNTTKQIQTLNLYRSLYVGFNFINFNPTTTWLDATLIDTTKSIIVARKPVVISSQFGEHYFEINLPATRFKNHQYKIELRLKNKILISKSFLVRN